LYILKALRVQGKHQDIVTSYGVALEDVTENNARHVALVSEALLNLGDLKRGEKLIQKAFSLAPNSEEAQIASIKYKMVQNQDKQAMLMLESFIQAFPDSDEGKLIQGNVYFSQQKFKEAIEIYGKVIARYPQNVISLSLFSAFAGEIRSQLSLEMWSDAKKSILSLTAKAPKHPLPKYFDAVLSFKKKEYESSKEKSFLVLKDVPNHMPTQLLLGAALYAEKSYEQAGEYLANYVNHVPTHSYARKLLAAVKLKQNRPDEAMNILLPVAEFGDEDGQLLTMIGQSAIESGNLDLGGEYLRKAAKSDSVDATAIRSELARIYLEQGEESRALDELKKLAATHPMQSQFMQAVFYAKNGKFTKAERIIKKLKKELPDDYAIELLLAQISLDNGNSKQAREHYSSALALKENVIPALLGLARLDLNMGDLLQAKINFEKIVNIESTNDIAMVGLAQISERDGDIASAIDWLEKARSSGRNKLVAQELLTKYYFDNNKVDLAVKIAIEAAEIHPEDKRALELLVYSQIEQKMYSAAIDTLKKIILQHPDDLDVLVDLANAQALNGNVSSAKKTLYKVVLKDKKHIGAQIGLVDLESQTGNTPAAIKIAKNIVRQYRQLAVGNVLLGDLSMRQKKYSAAEGFYKKAYGIQQTRLIVVKYASAISLGGDKKRALQPLIKWVNGHPEDVKTQVVLGTAYQAAGDVDKAIEMLEAVLSVRANSFLVLNNLSWLYSQKNDSRSIEYAERAYLISPNSSAINDTLGWLLVQNSKLKRGTELLERAVSLSNGNPKNMYHLAVAYANQGLSGKAEKTLKQLLKKDVSQNIRVKSEALLEKLSKS